MLADSFVVPNEISEINARPRRQLRLLATEAEEVLSSLDFIFWQESWQLARCSTEQLKQLQMRAVGGARGWGLERL